MTSTPDIPTGVMATSRGTTNQRVGNVQIRWDRSYRVHHEGATKALLKVTRNTPAYIAELARIGALRFGYEVPKKALTKGGGGVVQLSVQLYERELAFLMREARKDYGYAFATRVLEPLQSVLECTAVVATTWVVANKINPLQFVRVLFVWARNWLKNQIVYALPKQPRWTNVLDHLPKLKWCIHGVYSVLSRADGAKMIATAAAFLYYWLRTWKCYDVLFTCDTLAWDLMNKHPNLGRTQLTTDGISSHPIITTVITEVNAKYPMGDSVLKVRYNTVLRFLVAMVCDGRVECLSERASMTLPQHGACQYFNMYDPEDPNDAALEASIETKGLANDERGVVGVRRNTAALKTLRNSVEVTIKSDDELTIEKEKGTRRTLSTEDYKADQIGGITVGPELSAVSESLEQSLPNEIAAISRHLSKLESKVDGKELPTDADGVTEISEEANALLDKSANLIGSILADQISKDQETVCDFPDVNEYFPKKWGASTWETVKEWVAAQGEYVPPWMNGFVKQFELALPLNKLPRMVVSQGVNATAGEAEFWAVIENLLKKSFPHLVTKGKSEDEIATQIADLCRRSKSLKRLLISLDMSSMDASWTKKDRARVLKIAREILKQVEERLQTKLDNFGDTVMSRKEKEKVRVTLQYIRVLMSQDDSILFSGERKTSTGNRLLMLILVGAEFLRIYDAEILVSAKWGVGNEDSDDEMIPMNEGEYLIRQMMHFPDTSKKFSKDDVDPSRENEHANDFDSYTYQEGFTIRKNSKGERCRYPREPRDIFYDDDGVCEDQNMNAGDGDDDLLSLRGDMYATEEEFVRAWEKYGKLVEVCSVWGEDTNAEVLSKFIITTGKGETKRSLCIPKVTRNFGRLLMAKMDIPAGLFQSGGKYGYKLTQKNWIELATQYWNRSYALKHTLVLRQLCAAMFNLCVRHIGDGWMERSSLYDAEMHRLGKVDGDVKLRDMYEAIRCNVDCITDADCWAASNALVRAMHFKEYDGMKPSKVKHLQKEIILADELWKEIVLTDEMCHNPMLFVDTYPIDPELASELGFTVALVNRLKLTYLVKGQAEPPEADPVGAQSGCDSAKAGSGMIAPCGTGGARDAGADGRKAAVFVMIGELAAEFTDENRRVLIGKENKSSKRKDFASLPGGKVEQIDIEEGRLKGIPFWKCTGARELREETGYQVQAGDLNLVQIFDFCGMVNYVVYTTQEKLVTAQYVSGAHEKLLDLDWRTPADIFKKFHHEFISENIWRMVDQKRCDRGFKGTYKPVDEHTQYRLVSEGSQVLFLNFTGKENTTKHTYQITQTLDFYDITKINKYAQKPGLEVSPNRSQEATNGRGWSKSATACVGKQGTTSFAADETGVDRTTVSPPLTADSGSKKSSSPQGPTKHARDMHHGQGKPGDGKPGGSRRGVAIGPDMKDNDAQNTSQVSAKGGIAAPQTRSAPGLSNQDSAANLGPTGNRDLSANAKSDPGPPVDGAGLSNTGIVPGDSPIVDAGPSAGPAEALDACGREVQLPKPPVTRTKPAEASNSHVRPVDRVRKETNVHEAAVSKGRVGANAVQKKAGKPTSGSSPVPDTTTATRPSRGLVSAVKESANRRLATLGNQMQPGIGPAVSAPRDPWYVPSHMTADGRGLDLVEETNREMREMSQRWIPVTDPPHMVDAPTDTSSDTQANGEDPRTPEAGTRFWRPRAKQRPRARL